MGPLTLPTGGSVYVDANVLIYSIERIEPYRALLAPAWQEPERAGSLSPAASSLYRKR